MGIATRVAVRLTPDPPAVATMLCAFDSIDAASSTPGPSSPTLTTAPGPATGRAEIVTTPAPCRNALSINTSRIWPIAAADPCAVPSSASILVRSGRLTAASRPRQRSSAARTAAAGTIASSTPLRVAGRRGVQGTRNARRRRKRRQTVKVDRIDPSRTPNSCADCTGARAAASSFRPGFALQCPA